MEQETQENNKLIVKRDIVFKRIFAHNGNEEFLKQFLSALLKVEIQEIEILHDLHLEKDLEEDKLGIIDVRAIIDKEKIINIEVQIENEHNIVPRSTFYGAKLISDELFAKEAYQKLKPVIVICILNYKCFPYKEYINETVTVLSEHRKHIVNEYMKYYYVELPKFRASELNYEDITSQWLTFIDSENPERMKEIMKRNDTVKKAQEELEYLEGDAAFKRRVELREKYERDMNSAQYYGIQIGKEEGIKEGRKEGIEEGKKEGIKVGIKEGIKEGMKQEKIEIANNMLKENIDIETICKITGLTREIIEGLK